MTDSKAIDALVEKLKKADGPSREIDAEIACACGVREDWLKNDERQMVPTTPPGYVSAGKYGPGFITLEYTGSIDDTLTLFKDEAWALSALQLALVRCLERADCAPFNKWEVIRELNLSALRAQHAAKRNLENKTRSRSHGF